MQVFIVGTQFVPAAALDRKRLAKQIIECCQMLGAIKGEYKGYRNHPCTIQYKNHTKWLEHYFVCLEYYRVGNFIMAKKYSDAAEAIKPYWHTQDYFDNMKRRLYTKNHEHYKQWESLGESYENWYWVDNQWKIYKQKQ